MRQRRIKVAPEVGEAVYHCMTRTVNGERLFDEKAREILRRQLWLVADYCGVTILTYAILSNHFHVLIRVPQEGPIHDDELLRRYRVLYPKPTKYRQAKMEVIIKQLKAGGSEADMWRQRQRVQMGDVSAFMKLLKQRFSVWYNRNHDRYGTLWSERFKSVLIEPTGRAIEATAAYIDLNSVRAGLAQDPKDYRFSGYAEAIGGSSQAQAGLMSVLGGSCWSETQEAYRQILYGTGAGSRENGASLALNEVTQVLAEKGKLPLSTLLRCRVRYFTDGAILGSKAFVAAQLAEYQRKTGWRKRSGPQPFLPLTDCHELTTLRGFRQKILG